MPRRVLRRLVSPAGLLLVAFCFALPFVSVSCEAAQLRADYTGVDLVTGGTPSVSVSDETVSGQDAGDAADEPIGMQPAAAVAILAVLAGILVAALRHRRARLFGGAAAAVATVVLLVVNQILAKRQLSHEIEREVGAQLPAGAGGGDFVHTRYGFWLAVALACAVTVYNCVDLYRHLRARPPARSLQDQQVS